MNFKWAIPALLLTAVLFFVPSRSSANPDFTKKTGKKCDFCHIGSWNSGKLTEAGQYYKEHNTLKGFVSNEQPQGAQKH